MEHPVAVGEVIDQLGVRRGDALATLELLEGYRQQVEEHRADFENPHAVTQYVAFFADFVGRAVADSERIAGELPAGVQRAHVDTLRQIAGASAEEQRRCLQFRDKCINRPLPQERMRPLLNDISITTRDQLTAFRDFGHVADRLEALMVPTPPVAEPARSFDRRALFTRLFKP